MMIIATSPPKDARILRRFSTSHRGARANTKLRLQLGLQSASSDPPRYDQSDLLMRGNAFDQPAGSHCPYSDASSAALKSP